MSLSLLDSFRREVVDQLHAAAHELKVELLPIDIAVSVRGEYVVANALIAPPHGTRPEYADKMFLMYLSLPRSTRRRRGFRKVAISLSEYLTRYPLKQD